MTVDGGTSLNPVPKVNPPMFAVGESIPMDDTNTRYTKIINGEIVVDE